MTSRDAELIVEPGRPERAYWGDLWRYRELLQVLAWRDISVRYKQTVVGIIWALLRPLLAMIVFTIVFGRIAGLPSEAGSPYTLMVLAGMLPWTFFASAVSDGASSLIGNANLITKVYFPRMIVPAAALATALVDLLVGFTLIAALYAWYGILPSGRFVFLPAFVALALATALGPCLLLASLNVRFRDFRYVLPFVIQLGTYISPVGFSSEIIPAGWRFIYSLNPMVGVIDGFRWCLLHGKAELYWPSILNSMVVAALFIWIGWRQFRRFESSFADLV